LGRDGLMEYESLDPGKKVGDLYLDAFKRPWFFLGARWLFWREPIGPKTHVRASFFRNKKRRKIFRRSDRSVGPLKIEGQEQVALGPDAVGRLEQ